MKTMRLIDREPLNLITKDEYDRHRDRRLTVRDLLNDWLGRDMPEEEEGDTSYIARLVKRSSGAIAYAADFEVVLGNITVPRRLPIVPDLLGTCIKVTMLPLDEVGQPIDEEPEKRYVDTTGKVYPGLFSAIGLPLLQSEGGYILRRDHETDYSLRALLSDHIGPSDGSEPMPEPLVDEPVYIGLA